MSLQEPHPAAAGVARLESTGFEMARPGPDKNGRSLAVVEEIARLAREICARANRHGEQT